MLEHFEIIALMVYVVYLFLMLMVYFLVDAHLLQHLEVVAKRLKLALRVQLGLMATLHCNFFNLPRNFVYLCFLGARL